MATLTPTLTLVSANTSADETLSLSVTDSLDIGAPTRGMSKIATNATGGDDITIVPSGAANQYVYIKHTGFQADGSTATTNQLSVKFASTEGIRLAVGEFAYFPSKSDVVVNIVSSGAHAILVEYAYFTAS